MLACASPDPDAGVGSVRSAISGGQPDSADSSVFVLVSHRGSAGVALCTASLIAPNLLLTARHCVANVTTEAVSCETTEASAPFAANTLYAANPSSVEQATATFRASAVAVPSQATDICGFDLALVTLESTVPATVAQPLVPRLDRPVLRGEAYSAVGYGQDSVGDAGIPGMRIMRAGLKVSCAPGSCGAGVEASEFIGDTGICSGDSGGPALDADGHVVGVVSRSGDDCAHPVYGAVATWKDWIIGVTRQAALRGGYTPPAWAAGATGVAGDSSTAFGIQGDKCGAAADCTGGFGCFSPTGSSRDGYCAKLCDARTTCSADTHCQSGAGVCVKSSASVAASACAVASPGECRHLAPGAFLLGASLSMVSLWRRRGRVVRRAARISPPRARVPEGVIVSPVS